jgi:hypothetical protein
MLTYLEDNLHCLKLTIPEDNFQLQRKMRHLVTGSYLDLQQLNSGNSSSVPVAASKMEGKWQENNSGQEQERARTRVPLPTLEALERTVMSIASGPISSSKHASDTLLSI